MKLHFIKLLAKAPVGKSCGHPVGAKCINDIGRAYFIPHRIKIQAETRGNLGYFLYGMLKAFAVGVSHHLSSFIFLSQFMREGRD
ncbi:Uncharacterised protein [Mycobacteroides abscessus subsp. abscessus]|nr:Uncharacterised protein [Mycobacteroides abscessus subsp. abscessus]